MSAPAFPTSGSIEESHLADVLLALLRDGRDGCLTVSRGGITRRLYLRSGMIVYGSSTRRADRLGEILIVQGKLFRADLKRYWLESRSGNRSKSLICENQDLTLKTVSRYARISPVVLREKVYLNSAVFNP